MQEIVNIVCKLVDAEPDPEGNTFIIVRIKNRRYNDNIIKILRSYRGENLILKIEKKGV